MRITTATLIFLGLATTWSPAVSANNEPPALAHNPFSRPPAAARNIERGVADTNGILGPAPALRATMVGPAERLANVAGRVLKTGEEIHGYLLVAIHEDYVVFKKDGKLMTVHVKPQRVENDD